MTGSHYGEGPAVYGGGSSQQSPALTRRRALQLGGVAAGSLATAGMCAKTASAAAAGRTAPPRSESSFDEGWLFYRGDASGAEDPSFDDSAWRQLDLPHDWSIEDLPNPTSTDGSLTDYPSLLVTKNGGPPPGFSPPTPPTRIGPFSHTEGVGATAYMVGGIGWYRKTFKTPSCSERAALTAAHGMSSCSSTAYTRTPMCGSTAPISAFTPLATRRSRLTSRLTSTTPTPTSSLSASTTAAGPAAGTPARASTATPG